MAISCARLMTTNYLDVDILAAIEESSEKSNFPVTNVLTNNRRSKLWRSDGFWRIISGTNDTIIFRETAAGPDLTATIASGNYTSSSSFFAAVKAAFEATGSSVYTVAYDAQFRIVLTSDGAGGAGDFSLLWSNASTNAEGELGFEATDDTGSLSYTADSLVIHGSAGEWIVLDLGMPTSIRAAILADQRNKALSISPSATVRLQGGQTNPDPENWASSADFDITLTNDEEVMAVISDTSLGDTDVRFLRWSFQDENPNGYIQVGVLFAGDFYAPTQGRVQFPMGITPVDRSEIIFAEGGATFGDIREKSRLYNLQWSAMSDIEVEELLEIFEDFGITTPFFVSLDTAATYSSSQRRQIKYVKFEGPPAITFERPNFWRVSTPVREEL